MKFITIRDFLIILIILIPAMIFLVIKSSDNGGYAEFSYNGKIVKTVSLSEDTELTVNGVVFIIEDNSVSVSSSPCPDKICVKSGKIAKNGETIICLPERIAVRIISEDKNGNADIVVG